MTISTPFFFFFFFNDTATTEIYTLSLHDALPISPPSSKARASRRRSKAASSRFASKSKTPLPTMTRSEEHTSELQSQSNLVCRLLLEKKKKRNSHTTHLCRTSPIAQRHSRADPSV